MEWLNLTLAMLLPALLGVACAGLVLQGAAAPGRVQAQYGNGLLLGLLLVTLLMRLLDSIGAALSFTALASVLFVLLLAVAAGRQFAGHRRAAVSGNGRHQALQSSTARALFAFFLVLIAVRILTLGLELVWRPLFPWDATMHWATKAKVWFETNSIVPFVENQSWLELGGRGVFTDHHADYPVTIPLLQLWISIALGYWDESLINLPWLVCVLGLGLLFYGQGRLAGARPLVALTFTYLLLSMPLLNTHVALAGYADLFLGTCFCAAIAAFYNWTLSRQPGQACLALFFAACCPIIKNEGFFWFLCLFPGLILVLLPLRKAVWILVSATILAILLVVFLPEDLVIAGNSLAELRLGYRPGMLTQIAMSLFVFDNWHLLNYLLLATMAALLFLPRNVQLRLLTVVVVLAAAVTLFVVLFTSTRFAYGAQHFTAVGRISLHLVPSLLFLSMLVFDESFKLSRYGKLQVERFEN